MKVNNRELVEKVLELYSKRTRQQDICSNLNISTYLLGRILKRNGIETDRYRANHFNQSYFKQIDIKDKAYFLGLLYADGNIYLRRNRTQITLKNEDCYILELFNKYIDSSVKLYQDREYKKLILDSKELSGDLIKLGCIPNKSLVVTFPTEEQVPKELLHHFIRGYFDGNGSATIGKSGMSVSFTANEVFLSSLSKILSGVGIYASEYKKRYKDHEVSAGTIYISRRYDQRLLYTYMYNDYADLYLTRKELKFARAFQEVVVKVCTICGGKHDSKGLCTKHYNQQYHKLKKQKI